MTFVLISSTACECLKALEVTLTDRIKEEIIFFHCNIIILEEDVKLDPFEWWLEDKTDFLMIS